MEFVAEFGREIILFIMFSLFVYSTIEVVKGLFKSTLGIAINKKIVRWLNFGIGYIYAFAFNFQLVNYLLDVNKTQPLNKHVNYLIVASLLYVGAQRIWKYLDSQSNIMKSIK